MAHMNADHTPVEDAGRIAPEAGVKTLVLSHLIPAFDSISDDMARAGGGAGVRAPAATPCPEASRGWAS
jgi:ribonuclease BN (tRNA processing enzyme)